MNSIISVENLSVSFKNEKVINNLSFEIKENEKVAVSGASGKGKSTLLNILAGFIPDYTGDISIFGKKLTSQNIKSIRQEISWLPQETALNFNTVSELFFAAFELETNKKHKPTESTIKNIFSEFDLSVNLLNKKVTEISGGQKQRIMLAAAILLKKKLLFLDEPTSALDENLKQKITDYLFSKDITIVASTHYEYWIEKADKIIKM